LREAAPLGARRARLPRAAQAALAAEERKATMLASVLEADPDARKLQRGATLAIAFKERVH
jgi:hypothetical protein